MAECIWVRELLLDITFPEQRVDWRLYTYYAMRFPLQDIILILSRTPMHISGIFDNHMYICYSLWIWWGSSKHYQNIIFLLIETYGRYGQTKPTHIYRLVTDNSLEKKIYDRQVGFILIAFSLKIKQCRLIDIWCITGEQARNGGSYCGRVESWCAFEQQRGSQPALRRGGRPTSVPTRRKPHWGIWGSSDASPPKSACPSPH